MLRNWNTNNVHLFSHPRSPYTLKVLGSSGLNNGVRLRRIYFEADYIKDGRKTRKDPQVIAMDNRAAQLQPDPAERLMLADVPIGLFKLSIEEYERMHGEECTPRSPDLIRGLVVIDCEQRALVEEECRIQM
jgi:hypothetical protein